MTLPALTARGEIMDLSPDAFGYLRRSDDIAQDSGHELRARMAEDGYLYLPGLLSPDAVLATRRIVLERAAAEGILDPAYPQEDGILKEGIQPYFRPGYTKDNPALHSFLYGGTMTDMFARLLDGPIRHFDYTWLRAIGPGPGTAPHCDIVYMGRGTLDLYTAWTPLGNIPLSVGGLMILENSHQHTNGALSEYLHQDVDTYCENGPNAENVLAGKFNWEHWDGSFEPWDGSISHDPPTLQKHLGGRWLTAPEYHMGDVLIFSMRTVHASIDNQTRTLRLSTDSRYQRTDQPIDERWIGDNPIAHGPAGKRSKIC